MTDVPTTETAFQRKLRERREAQAAKEAAAPTSTPRQEFDEDLIPEDPYDKSDADQALDDAVASIDIVVGYLRWCGKMVPTIAPGQTESIMISCPKPGHRDRTPSAWLNTEKQTWFCGTCQEGGDVHDIAAWHFNYPVPGYKNDATFHKLRIDMAKDFGYTFHTLPGGVEYVQAPSEDEEQTEEEIIAAVMAADDELAHEGTVAAPEPVIAPEETIQSTDAEVIDLFEMDDEDIIYPSLDWKAVVPRGSFLDKYMELTTVDDVTEEYHFFNALLALSFACGRRARLYDLVPVHANLFIVTLGDSGAGKSKARYHLDQLLVKALPHDWTDPESRGVRKMNAPASAEVLIYSFQKPVTDPDNPKKIEYYAPVSGLIDFNELSALVGRANRVGNTLKPTLMQFYDMESLIETSSMTSGVKTANQPFACALTTTQPRALSTLLGRGDTDSGFLNRWLFVAGPPKQRYAIGGVRVDMTPAVDPLRAVLSWSGSFRDDEFVQWSDEAAAIFTDFFHSVIEPAKKANSTGLITRIDLFMKKLILLLSANKMDAVVTDETVNEAIRCYQYIIDCYAIPESQIGNSLFQEVSDAIISLAQKYKDSGKRSPSLSDMSRALRRRGYQDDMILKVCDVLCKIGHLEAIVPRTGAVGRPTVRYKYVG